MNPKDLHKTLVDISSLNYLKWKKNSPKFQSFEVIRPTLTWFTPSGGSL